MIFFSYGGRGGGRGGRGGGGGFGGGRKEKFSGPGSTLRKPRWDMDSLPKFEKNFYREHPNVQARPMVSVLQFSNCLNKCTTIFAMFLIGCLFLFSDIWYSLVFLPSESGSYFTLLYCNLFQKLLCKNWV